MGMRMLIDQPAETDLRDAVNQFELPIALVDLDDFTVHAISESAVAYIGVEPCDIVGKPIANLLSPDDRKNTVGALQALSDGIIDFYTAKRRVGAPGAQGLSNEWVRAVTFGDRKFAIIEAAPGAEPQDSPLTSYLGRAVSQMVVGTADSTLTVTSISCDAQNLLGVSPGRIIGQPLLGVNEHDVRTLLDADVGALKETSVAVRLRLRNGEGSWTPMCCILTSLADTAERLFILMPDPDPPSYDLLTRAAELERHLIRIAAEVEASGILLRMGGVPETARLEELAGLTARQWEVMSRLLRGDRVPTIAAELYISQSTVRNHLSAIFEHFGVHSQAELLALLRERDVLPA